MLPPPPHTALAHQAREALLAEGPAGDLWRGEVEAWLAEVGDE